ncbi:MAG: Flp pilus assembly complex ATPase component TadA [Candidatus Harrisonbacteria bacterium]|nr:Flp pilus assembly complex ATPase component TadA [Candidatus Harrisonbacteria bacterium]
MRIPNEKLKELLITEKLIDAEEFDKIVVEAGRMGFEVADILVSRGFITKKYFYDLVAAYFGVKKASLSSQVIDEKILHLLPKEISREKRAVVFRKEEDGSLAVAMEDPSDLASIEFLKRYLKADIRPYIASPEDFNEAFSVYSRGGVEDFRWAIEENVAASIRASAAGAEKAAEELPIVAIVDNLLAYAASLRASDIHLEVLEDILLVRYRIDGILREMMRLPKEVHSAITARIKLLASLKLDEHTRPQDGRFRQKLEQNFIDLRVSVIPTFYGEKVEMRLLTAAQRPLSFVELGMLPDTIKIVEENIHKTYGMVLICGPTGSGKTTTLYSILNGLNHPEVNIVTIEDPVEYNIKYVNQTQINPQAGITFSSGLRALLRQDPNIILVGEIRDPETAEISVNAALTGHLLLSTLHTNDAPTAIPRLTDLKIPPFLVSAVLNMAFAQRLVGKICNDCIESYKPTDYLLQLIKKQIEDLGIESLKLPKTLFRGKGCKSCGHSGLKGRIGIYEVLNVDDEIRAYIINPDFSLDGLRKLARKRGMITMFEDGLRKAMQGMTTVEEVLRVIRE